MVDFKVTHRDPFVKSATPQRYCGPTALSALTGYTAECCGAWINYHRGNPIHFQTRGTNFSELHAVCRKLGVGFTHVSWRNFFRFGDLTERGNLTINLFRKELAGGGKLWHLADKFLLVNAHHHWLAVHRGMVVDSGHCAGGDPIPLRDYRMKRGRVSSIYVIEKDGKRLEQEPLPR